MTQPIDTFRTRATRAVDRLGRTFGQLLAELGDPPGPRGVGRALGVGVKPAWQIYRIANAAHPLDEAFNVPRPGTMRSILRAARRRAVPQRLLDEVRAAYDAFDAVAVALADDRDTFDHITSALSPPRAAHDAARAKRAAHLAARELFGMHADARISCMIAAGCPDQGATIDIAIVDAVVRHRLLRPDRPPYIVFTSPLEEEAPREEGAGTPRPPRTEPLLPPEELTAGVPLLTDFCSTPLPEMRSRTYPSGLNRTELVTHGLGNESSATFAFANVIRGVAGPQGEKEPCLRSETTLRIPVGALVLDILVDRDRMPVKSARTATYVARCRHGEAGGEYGASDRLWVTESVTYLGAGLDVLRLGEMSNYVEMIGSVLVRLGWSPERFDAYRCRVEHPVVQTATELVLSIG